MKSNKYKILVLSDLKNSTKGTLSSTVSLAKMIGGTIEFFYVKKPTDVITQDNQFSAIRTFNKDFNTSDKKIKALLKSISIAHNLRVKYKFTIGNVKDEIVNHINEVKPDIIVLGKRKSKLFSFIGDNITKLVLKHHKGPILFSAQDRALEPNKKISLGVFQGGKKPLDIDFADLLIQNTQSPMKYFKIGATDPLLKSNETSDLNRVEYVFEEGDNSIENLSKYLLKNNINLFCIDREKVDSKDKMKLMKNDLKHVISTLDVSLLITGEQRYDLQ